MFIIKNSRNSGSGFSNESDEAGCRNPSSPFSLEYSDPLLADTTPSTLESAACHEKHGAAHMSSKPGLEENNNTKEIMLRPTMGLHESVLGYKIHYRTSIANEDVGRTAVGCKWIRDRRGSRQA